MNIDKLVLLIDKALLEADKVADKSQYYTRDTEPISSTKKVLFLLKEEAQNNSIMINKRVLRAMHDLGMSTYKEFENTSLAKAINDIIEFLYYEVPEYNQLEPLRSDFGKGDPI